jgi:ketosteroid isomerase-like protein
MKRAVPQEEVEQARIERIRRETEYFNAGDLDSFLGGLADDAELFPDPSFPEGGPFKGRDEIRGFYSGLREGWDSGTTVILREVKAAGEKVLFAFEWRAVGEASGIETSSDWYCVNTYRGDEVVRVDFFSDRDAAINAAGLMQSAGD